jgi:D-amino-acid oxidase
VHDYGHGGTGVLLSWGCARDAVKLLMTDSTRRR